MPPPIASVMSVSNATISFTNLTEPMPLLPLRIYEPNIIHNPTTWMGIWTPHGWRVHAKRWGRAQRKTITLSGDGKTTFFPHALSDPDTGRVEWQDDLHLKDDPFTDAGIYPSDPRVEYPAGRPRWAVSHTLLCYPVADHTLYTHEYTWDMTHGHLQTHFRRHVEVEEAVTDDNDGMTVRVRHTPISRTIEGNVHYPLQNSAVRGVWTQADKSGPNLYACRVIQKISMHNGVYAIAPRTPVLQCHGMYHLSPEEAADRTMFDAQSGECLDRDRLKEVWRIPIDLPKLGMLRFPTHPVSSQLYEAEVGMLSAADGKIDQAQLDLLEQRMGSTMKMGLVGYAHENAVDSDDKGYRGYDCTFDLNDDGVIDDQDRAILSVNLGRRVRYNLYLDAYFGGDWLTTSINIGNTEHRPGTPALADYEYGGGYDAESGTIRLLDTPGPGQRVFVEYHHDVPAEPGDGNIVVHLFKEHA